MHTINWYPGHMAKARRMLEDNLKLVDMIIEIVDARAPMACRNPDFEALFKNKLRVVVLNKSDLSSKTQNRAWISYFAKQGITAAEFISTQPSTRKRAIELIEKTGEETVRRYREKGIKKTLRAMVVGVPNVGKSTFINRIAGAARAQVGDLKCVNVINSADSNGILKNLFIKMFENEDAGLDIKSVCYLQWKGFPDSFINFLGGMTLD